MAGVDYLLPPRTPTSVLGHYNESNDENYDIKLGEDLLNPGFQQHLERFYHKASPSDQKKCLQLLSKFQSSKEGKRLRRTKTAMASLGSDLKHYHPLDPYLTEYTKEYPSKAVHTQAVRPQTSQLVASYDLDGPIGNTTYDMEYYDKKQRPAEPIRTGTSSGARRNNPHPQKAFTVWKFPKNGMPLSDSGMNQPLSDELMDKVLRGQLRSTYQYDYIGVPQGHTVHGYYSLPGTKDWKAEVPYTLDSTKRASYQQPNQHRELLNNVTRFGCNKTHGVPAYGTVPTSHPVYMNMRGKTTYHREFNEKAPGRMSSTGVGASISDDIITARPPSTPSSIRSTKRSRIPAATPLFSGRTNSPSWVPTWTGPQ